MAVTGDLLTHPRGEPRLRRLVARLPEPTFAVLGNHDVAIARDPLAAGEPPRARTGALLLDEGELVELRAGRSGSRAHIRA